MLYTKSFSKGCEADCDQAFNEIFEGDGGEDYLGDDYTDPEDFETISDLMKLKDYLWYYAQHYDPAKPSHKGHIHIEDCPNYRFIKEIVDRKIKEKEDEDNKQKELHNGSPFCLII